MIHSPYREWLRYALGDSDISQSELARRMTALGVPMTADKINKVLQGTRRLQADEAVTAAEAMNIPGPAILVDVVGRVGADPEGKVLFSESDGGFGRVPLPPGGSLKAVAVEVAGYSMRGLADDGSLIYYEDRRDVPSEDMIGQIVVVATPDGEVMVKRLLRGAEPGLYDLESISGTTRRNAQVAWAAHITAIVPPHQARRIIRNDPGG